MPAGTKSPARHKQRVDKNATTHTTWQWYLLLLLLLLLLLGTGAHVAMQELP
jgi:hypothetical protein